MDNDCGMAICEQLERIANALERIASARAAQPPEATQHAEQPRQRTEIDWAGDFMPGKNAALSRIKKAIENEFYRRSRGWDDLLSGYNEPLCVEDLIAIGPRRMRDLRNIGDIAVAKLAVYLAEKHGRMEWINGDSFSRAFWEGIWPRK
jgi:hypothetical protein